MAGDWIKMRTHLGAERATMVICDLTGLDEFAVVGRLHAIWVWAGEHTVTGDVTGVTLKTVDRVTRCEKFGEAMVAAGWLETLPDGGVRFPRWKRHNSKAAKARALAAERQARKRNKQRDAKRDGERDSTVTSHAPREEQEESKRRGDRLPEGNGKAIGSSVSPSRLLSRLPKDALDGVNWSAVTAIAESVGRKIPPLTTDDRRNWLKFGVMTQLHFTQDWLMDAVEAVLRATETRKTKQAHLYGVLKAKAIEDNMGDLFKSMLRGIEIPEQVWKSGVLEIRK